MKDLVSIIVPVFNVSGYIEKCLESVAIQTFTGKMECILIDDCGGDDSILIAERFIHHYDGMIDFRIIHHETNRGLSAARNTGIEAANGNFITFLDSDDYISPLYIEKLYMAINQNDNFAISTCMIYKDVSANLQEFDKSWCFSKEEIIEGKDFTKNKMLLQSPFAAWGKLYRSSLFDKVRFRIGKINEDTLFMYDIGKIMKTKKYREIIIPDYLIFYRIRPNSICTSKNRFFSLDVIENYHQLYLESRHDDFALSFLLLKDYSNRLMPLVAKQILANREMTEKYYDITIPCIKDIPLVYFIILFISDPYFRFYLKIRLFPKKTKRDVWGD